MLFGRQRSRNSFAATVAVSASFPFVDRYIDPAPAIFVELAIEDLQGAGRLQRRWTGLSSRSQSGAWSLCWLIAQSRQSTVSVHVNEGYGVERRSNPLSATKRMSGCATCMFRERTAF